MLFHFALLGLATALVPRAPAPAVSGVCTSAPYNKLAPLAYFPDAQKFCSKKYPQTVTVTAGPKLRRGISTTTSSTTAPYTTPATTPAPTTRASTTSTRSTTSAEKCTKNPLECLYSSVKKGEKNGVAATFCSCYGPAKTVTVQPTPTPNPSECASAPIDVFGNCPNGDICLTLTTCSRQPSEEACRSTCEDAEDNECVGPPEYNAETGECIFRPDCCPHT